MAKTKQFGGEMKETYSSIKSDMHTKQFGGEMMEAVSKKGGSEPNPNMHMAGEDYCGPGKYLSTQG